MYKHRLTNVNNAVNEKNNVAVQAKRRSATTVVDYPSVPSSYSPLLQRNKDTTEASKLATGYETLSREEHQIPPLNSTKITRNNLDTRENIIKNMSFQQRETLMEAIYEKSCNLQENWRRNIWEELMQKFEE
jgi:cobalamin biosynthesis Mg chelatase CobN